MTKLVKFGGWDTLKFSNYGPDGEGGGSLTSLIKQSLPNSLCLPFSPTERFLDREYEYIINTHVDFS
jgi:hypothetical protein